MPGTCRVYATNFEPITNVLWSVWSPFYLFFVQLVVYTSPQLYCMHPARPPPSYTPSILPWHCWRASVVLLFSYFGSFVIFIGPHRVKNVQRFGNLVEYCYMLAGSRCAVRPWLPRPLFLPLPCAHKMRKSQSRTMNASNSYGSNSNCATSISST